VETTKKKEQKETSKIQKNIIIYADARRQLRGRVFASVCLCLFFFMISNKLMQLWSPNPT